MLNGITFSAVFFAYDVQILLTVFALTSLNFGVLAAYGWFTKRDLSGLRPILTAGLIFLLVFWLISMFLPLSGFDRIICFVGLAVFMGLTAYDTQKIKQLHAAFEGDYEMSKKASCWAAQTIRWEHKVCCNRFQKSLHLQALGSFCMTDRSPW